MEQVVRYRTAMSRTFLSRPLQQALLDGLLEDGMTVFDYGCGRGDDVRALTQLGMRATGWDPTYAPDVDRVESDVVNLGYVVNVIEDPTERVHALRDAWALARSVLVVAARLTWDPDSKAGKPYRDGRITGNGTFQKYYEPNELKEWIESHLGTSATTAAPGICYVFRHKHSAQKLLARHSKAGRHEPRRGVAELLYSEHSSLLAPIEEFASTHSQLPSPVDIPEAQRVIEVFGSVRAAFSVIRKATAKSYDHVDLGRRSKREQRFEEHLEELQPLIDFTLDRGRLPRPGELGNEESVSATFGSVRAAFSLIRHVAGPFRWEAMATRAREDFKVYLALAAFEGRPLFRDLPTDLQHDAKDLFGSYKAACEASDELLYSLANQESLSVACDEAVIGKKTAEALYVHTSALERLSPLLRVYAGTARVITGNVDDATLVKMHRLKAQVSFLIYPDFDSDPHPALSGSLVARLPVARADYKDFSMSDNPPILHRKECFVPSDYPLYDKFARLTRQEEKAKLLDDAQIGRRRQWDERLAERGLRLRGHRLIRATA